MLTAIGRLTIGWSRGLSVPVTRSQAGCDGGTVLIGPGSNPPYRNGR
jgi:hypothetical protein